MLDFYGFELADAATGRIARLADFNFQFVAMLLLMIFASNRQVQEPQHTLAQLSARHADSQVPRRTGLRALQGLL